MGPITTGGNSVATPEPTLGESRVRLAFNPSANDTVTKIKEASALLIDLCESLKSAGGPSEANRCFSVAQTEIESAAMWAVKGATAQK